jgi:hypothetical protein
VLQFQSLGVTALRDFGLAQTLHIESVPVPFAHESTLDNFIIDNVVVLFKTRVPGPFADPLAKTLSVRVDGASTP